MGQHSSPGWVISGPEGRSAVPVVDILNERYAQHSKFGQQNHTPETWLAILTEEVGELAEAVLKATRSDPENHGTHSVDMRTEAVQIAAVAIAFLECLSRREAGDHAE